MHFPFIKADWREGPVNGTFFEVDRGSHVKVVFAAILMLAIVIALH